jgi:hypothetical protein
MAVAHEKLAQGQLAATVGTIYTAPVGKTAYLKSVYLHNTGSTDQTIKIYINGATTADKILEGIVSGKDLFEWDIAYNITLTTGQTLQAESTSATTVNYFVYGGTE